MLRNVLKVQRNFSEYNIDLLNSFLELKKIKYHVIRR